ncbi:MAG: serine hydrolase [Bacteroidetes bacterium HGW-Bacteroidetes-3]|jgi:CubicO group peptidase (beta-lactamase class C family)|nr:MAG: serine hydrolase [Bacteroidetes bacterium HGW-Bacteroidetes-3]
MKNPIHGILKTLSIIIFVCLCSTHNYAQDKKANSSNALPLSTPEAEGVSSVGILKFLDAVEDGKNELHSFVILRHGKIISEGWWSPYGKELKHIMYSTSKSFTSIGVGLAIAENKLKLTDKIAVFFPQSIPDTIITFMKEMTVQDLLKMSAGMDTDPLFNVRNSTDWPKVFLSSNVENKPGTVFKYNNMATFMLSAIVQKATGEKLVDYLKLRLFEPLGIKNFSWDETPEGYTFGAIGLKLQSEDMAKFGQLLLQKGEWNGKQIVPKSWVEEATSFQIMSNDPPNKLSKDLNDWEQGYGYQFWMCRNNAFRADGLGGQFIIVLPEKDAVVVLTASAANTQEELNLVWDNLLPAMLDKPLAEDKKASDELAERIASLSTLRTSSSTPAALLTKISRKKIEIEKNEAGIQTLSISMTNTDAWIQIDFGNEKHEFTTGLDNWKLSQTKLNTLVNAPRPTQVLPIYVASKYSWIDAVTLEITIKFVEESIRSEVWILHFEENGPEIKVHVETKVYVEFMGINSRMLEGRIVN